ncbi:MAG: hypothetical protein Q7S52_05245 [bacterium]|nr:hypothetical protein [bacterium]
MHNTPLMAGVAVVAVLVLFAAVYYMKGSVGPADYAAPEAPAVAQPAAIVSEEESLGGALYEKANNPLEDKLPEQSPVANPIDGAYKNPF